MTLRSPIDVHAAARQLYEFLSRCDGRVAVLTGAGISTDSGIPDYRGPRGIYSCNKDYKPIQYQQFVNAHESRQRYWARSFLGWLRISQAKPNTSHKALATLESISAVSGIITQNVDGLHVAAGSRNVLEIHGVLALVDCISCGHSVLREDLQQQLAELNPIIAQWAKQHPDRIDGDVSSSVNPDGDVDVTWDYKQFQYPSCPKCKTGLLKPNVVFFGENMPSLVRDASYDRIDQASGLLVIGTSLHVYSAYRLIKRAADSNKHIAIMNVGPTRGDKLAEIRMDLKSSDVLDQTMKMFT